VLPTIARWRTRYRVGGENRGGAERLERAVRERAAESYAAALEEVFGADPAVYVLRRVRMDLTLVNAAMADEPSIARKWGERTCAAVVQTVMRHGDDASRVMRFDDTSAYIAQWIGDLLEGVAWERWYYSAFARYRALSVDDAIAAVLLENRQHLAAILRRLGGKRLVPALLARMPREVARELWNTAIRGEPHAASREEFRVFVRAAFAIADALELWVNARPEESEIFEEYCATSPRSPDWKQAPALAEAVFAVLLFLQRRSSVRRAAVSEPPRVREAVAAFEWLDREWLAAALEVWLRNEEPRELAAARPPEMTALQRRIVDVLRQLLASGVAVLPDAEAASERNALARFAALAAAEPSLAAHAAVPAAVAWVLQQQTASAPAAARVSSSAQPAPAIESACAGLFLLTRVVIETRLTQLAEAYGLEIEDVLLDLAEEWQCDVEDPGIVLWSGGRFGRRGPDDQGPYAQDPGARSGRRSTLLHSEIVRLMRDRAAFAPSLAPDENATMAMHLLRLWAYWLRGFAQASGAWLLQQLILRPGVLQVDDARIHVTLRPAPLDVVLEMAHYLDPIAAVPWLGDRRVTFAIDRSRA
jgi:hypothetical protein